MSSSTDPSSPPSSFISSKEYDIIIVGAGVAGPALAVAFGNQGRKVLIVERDLREPDRIVGELMQPAGLKCLKNLGLEHTVEGIDAVETEGYHIIYNGESVDVPYPLIKKDEITESKSDKKVEPAQREKGCAFHHGRFIMKLRQAARNAPNVTVLEATVTDLVTNPYTGRVLGVKTTEKSGSIQSYFAHLTFVCDGTFSKFRKDFSPKPVTVTSHFVGLVLQDATLPAPHNGHVILGNHAPILVYQIGTHETRMLCDIQGDVPSIGNGSMAAHLKANVLPNVPKVLQSSLEKAIDDGRFRTMPNQHLTASKIKQDGVVFLGDSWNMRHPLTGGGMTVALNDVWLLSQMLESVKDFEDSNSVRTQLDAFFVKRKSLGSVVNILAQSLYALFAAGYNPDLLVLQKGCFRYFKLGGECVNGPVSLLSGLKPDPVSLVLHFFAVALYGVFTNLFDHGIAGFPQAVLQIFTSIYAAAAVIAPHMLNEVKWR